MAWEARGGDYLAGLDRRAAELARACEEKERVIQDLVRVRDERDRVIQSLSAVAGERLAGVGQAQVSRGRARPPRHLLGSVVASWRRLTGAPDGPHSWAPDLFFLVGFGSSIV